MAKAWWRDSDYELFARLTKERDEARADLSVAMSRIEAIARELGCDAQTMVEDPSVAWAELERVKTSCRMWSADMYEAGDLCNRHGNEMPIDAVRRFVSSKTAIVDMLQDRLSEARAEVERLRRMLPVHPSSLTDVCTDAYRRGAEAMREACAQVDPYELHRSNAAFARSIDTPASVVRIMQEGIRALPIPGEP